MPASPVSSSARSAVVATRRAILTARTMPTLSPMTDENSAPAPPGARHAAREPLASTARSADNRSAIATKPKATTSGMISSIDASRAS